MKSGMIVGVVLSLVSILGVSADDQVRADSQRLIKHIEKLMGAQNSFDGTFSNDKKCRVRVSVRGDVEGRRKIKKAGIVLMTVTKDKLDGNFVDWVRVDPSVDAVSFDTSGLNHEGDEGTLWFRVKNHGDSERFGPTVSDIEVKFTLSKKLGFSLEMTNHNKNITAVCEKYWAE